jgi:hypothetical protein
LAQRRTGNGLASMRINFVHRWPGLFNAICRVPGMISVRKIQDIRALTQQYGNYRKLTASFNGIFARFFYSPATLE